MCEIIWGLLTLIESELDQAQLKGSYDAILKMII